MRLLKLFFGLTLLISIAIASLFWFYPTTFLRGAAWLLKATGATLEPGQVEGNPHAGWIATDLKYRSPSLTVSADRVELAVRWKELFSKKLSIRVLDIQHPQISLLKKPSAKKEKKKDDESDKSSWKLIADRVAISSGVFNYADVSDWSPDRVTDINMVMSIDETQARLESLHAALWNGTVDAKGTRDISSGTTNGELLVKNILLPAGGSATQKPPTLSGTIRSSESGFDARIRLRQPNTAESPGGDATIELTGTALKHRLSFLVKKKEKFVKAEASGSYQNKKWDARWSRVQARILQSWETVQPFTTEIASGNVRVSDLRMRAGSATFVLDGVLAGDQLGGTKAHLTNFNLAILSEMGFVKYSIAGIMNLDVELQGKLSAPTGLVSLKIDGGAIEGQSVGAIAGNGRFDKERFTLTNLDIRAPTGNVNVKADIPIKTEGKGIPAFRMNIKSSRFDPAPLANHLTPVRLENSAIDADLQIEWTGKTLNGAGSLNLTAAKLEVPEAGVQLKNAVFELIAEGDLFRIKNAKAESAKRKGSMVISGFVKPSAMDIQIKTSEFEFNHPMGITGRLQANIGVVGEWAAPLIKGDVNILEANYQPDKKTKAEKKKKPVPSETKPPSNVAIDLRVKFDRNVWFKQGQSSIEANGDLRVKKDRGAEVVILGSIETIRGTYYVYGRGFKIERGRVAFLGEEELNPTLDILAIHTTETNRFKVTLTITGTLRQPILKLTSNPPLEEVDIIGVLVTGAPLSDPDQAKNNQSSEAAQILAANYLAEKARQSVQDTVDIDVLQFKITEGGGSALTVGKNLSDEFFVSFSQTLGPEGQRQVDAEYELSKHWSLEGTTTSVGRYVVDLLFRFGFF